MNYHIKDNEKELIFNQNKVDSYFAFIRLSNKYFITRTLIEKNNYIIYMLFSSKGWVILRNILIFTNFSIIIESILLLFKNFYKY